MSSRVTIANKTDLCFKVSTILFSESETLAENFWESKTSNSIISKKETVSFGKLIHSDQLPSSANIIASIILSCKDCTDESFIILKSRVKNSKTGNKVYVYASSFLESHSITRPQWYKGTAKVNHFMS